MGYNYFWHSKYIKNRTIFNPYKNKQKKYILMNQLKRKDKD